MVPYDEVDESERDAYMIEGKLSYVRVEDNSSIDSEDSLEKQVPIVCTTMETNGSLNKTSSADSTTSLSHVNISNQEDKIKEEEQK